MQQYSFQFINLKIYKLLKMYLPPQISSQKNILLIQIQLIYSINQKTIQKNYYLTQTKTMLHINEIQHTMTTYVKTFQQYKNSKINMQQFADGWIFATLLRSATNFKIKYGELIENCNKWTYRLSNLKKLVLLIQEYFQQQVKKGIKTKDIDLIQIAKNFNKEQIFKMFQIVIAVLTEAPNKQDHINTIMSLDQKSQTAFVSIIQDLLQNRILDKNETKQDKILQTLNHLQMQNNILRNQVQSLLNQNHQLNKQIEQVKNRQNDYIQQLNKIRDQQIDKTHVLHQEPKEKQHLRNMIDNLKQKLISTVRESQIRIAELKEENHILQEKCLKYQYIQEQLDEYKRKYTQTVQNYGKAKLWQRQKGKLVRTIQQKQQIIRKINAKLDQANQMNFSLQERQVYTKMELQKRDVRFKQLQKEVRKKYGANSNNLVQNPSSSKSLQLLNTNVAILSQQINQIDRLQIEQLKNQIEQLKKKNRQTQRQNNKLKRNLQKTALLQNEKKKLQRLILDSHNEKRDQVQVLLTTTYQFYSQNYKLKQILTQNGITI